MTSGGMASQRNQRVVSPSSPYVSEENRQARLLIAILGSGAPDPLFNQPNLFHGSRRDRTRRRSIELRIFEDPNEMVGDSGSFD
jgi:hypothetical protein